MRLLFGDYVLDAARRELYRGAEPVEVEPLVFDLLLHLIENRDRVVSKDDLLAAVWQGRVVSDSTLNSRINAARRAVGDSGERQSLIRTVARRGFRFVGKVREEAEAGSERAAASSGPLRAAPVVIPSQEVIFCRAKDGVHLAVAISGAGPPVVQAPTWLNHIEFDWHSPVWSPLWARLTDQFRLIRYDGRGNGLSDRQVPETSFDAIVHDLETVVDSLDLQQFALLGISQGAACAIAYAARHPARVSRLVLCGGYPQGWRKRGNADEIARREALIALIRHGWGQDNPAFHQVFTTMIIPGANQEEMQWFNDLQRISTSAENAARRIDVFGNMDVVDLLPRVRAPTLVLHSRSDHATPFEQGLMIARGIPGARFVALDSNNHLILSHEPAWPRFISEVCSFLAGSGESDQAYQMSCPPEPTAP